MKAKARKHPLVKQARGIILSTKVKDLPDLNVNEVARQMDVSPEHLSRTFKEQAGFSVKDMINVYIMNHGRKMLKRGKKVRDVSEILGCSSLSYFRKMFMKVFRLNPDWYRRLRFAPEKLHQNILKENNISNYLE